MGKPIRSGKTASRSGYDETAPCALCGLPVQSASMGGTLVCPWCDCGAPRNEAKWAIDGDKISGCWARCIKCQHRTESHTGQDSVLEIYPEALAHQEECP